MRFQSAALAALSFPFVTHGKKSFSDEGRGTAVSEHPFYDVMLSYIFSGFDSTKKHKDPPPSIEKQYPKKQGVLRNVQPDAAIEKDPSAEAKRQKINIDIGILGSLPRTDGQRQDETAPQHFQSAQDVYHTEQYYDEEYSFNAADDPVSMYDPYSIDGGALGSDSIESGQQRMTPKSGCPDPRPVVNKNGDLSGGLNGGLHKLVANCHSNSLSLASCPEEYKGGLECWDVSLVFDLSYAAYNLYDFNDDLGGWDVSKVSTMKYMFSYTFSFNRDISPWQVGNVKDMKAMFSYSSFNRDISQWDVSKVSTMNFMFGSSAFNQDISPWQVGNVKDMSYMFDLSPFNQDISPWLVGNVKDMTYMFAFDVDFDQNLGTWAARVQDDVNTFGMFSASGCPNEDDPEPGEQPWCSYATSAPSESAISSSLSKQPSSIPSNALSGSLMSKQCEFLEGREWHIPSNSSP